MLRPHLFPLLIAVAWTCLPSAGLDLEYVSPEQKQKLMAQFEQATQEKPLGAVGKSWKCDMYGVRSRLQVQRNVNLYSLTVDSSGVIKNTGSHPVHEYKTQEEALVGATDRFEDRVRMTKDGQVISKLTVLKPERMVVAYSVCSAR